MTAAAEELQEVRIKFLQDIVAAVVAKIDAPALESTLDITVLFRIVGVGDPRLHELAEDLGRVKSRRLSVGAGNDGARGGIPKARRR